MCETNQKSFVLIDCGHRYCEECILKLGEEKKKC